MYESKAVAMDPQLNGHSSVCLTGCSNNHQGLMKVCVHKAFSFHEIIIDDNKKR